MLALGRRLGAVLKPGRRVVTLSGPSVRRQDDARPRPVGRARAQGEVPSPSFALVQPYEMLKLPVWHVDLYRIDDPSELDELGLDDAGEEGVLLVEWPEHAGRKAWPRALALSLEVLEDGSRALTAEVPAAWEGRWPPDDPA